LRDGEAILRERADEVGSWLAIVVAVECATQLVSQVGRGDLDLVSLQ
jgi:hypothetical protein